MNNEYEYYSKIANWSFDDINYTSELLTDWDYADEIKRYTDSNSKILDLGTGGGEFLLNNFPEVSFIMGTDFSSEMIKTANDNLIRSGKKNICFKVMDNLNMDTFDSYFDLVTARNTVTDPKQIYKTLKPLGYLIIRGVDKYDSLELKELFGRGQGYNDDKPISLVDYENIINAGFKDVTLTSIDAIDYFKTKKDLFAFLTKTPIINNFDSSYDNDIELFEKYVSDNKTEKGIKLVRKYYGIVARKM